MREFRRIGDWQLLVEFNVAHFRIFVENVQFDLAHAMDFDPVTGFLSREILNRYETDLNLRSVKRRQIHDPACIPESLPERLFHLVI